MHELSIVMSILDIARQQMQTHDAVRLEQIELEIGTLAGVEMDAFNFAWEAAVVNTVMEKTKRIVHEIPGKARCLSCGHQYELAQLFDPCPICGEYLNELIQGKELRIKSLIVD